MLDRLPRFAERVLLEAMRLRGYRTRDVPTSVGVLHALDARGRGSLPPVVVLHGLSASGLHYERFMSRLRPHVSRVVALDMPGHGYSERPAMGLNHETLGAGLREGLDQLIDEPCIVFGNSMGGIAAVRYAVERPNRVLGLMLAAPGGAPMGEDDLEAFREDFRLHDHGKALDFIDRLFHRPHPMRHLLAWGIRHQFARTGVDDLLRGVRPEDLLRPEELESLKMPVFVVWGEADRVLLPENRRFFEQHLPAGAEVHRIEEYGHVPHMSHPECLAERLVEFARRLKNER